MAPLDAEQSPLVTSDGAEVRKRRKRIGMGIEDLAAEADVSSDTLSDYERGVRSPHPSTVRKVREALERIEHETGIDAPPPADARIVKFDVSAEGGFHVVVSGPVDDADKLRHQVTEIIREIRREADSGKG